MIVELTEFPALYHCLTVESREILHDSVNGIMIRNPQTEISYGYANTKEVARELFHYVDQRQDDFVIYGEYLKDELNHQLHIEGGKPFYYATCVKTVPQKIEETDISYHKLDETFINQVIQHYSYQECANETYISQCIQAGMIGAFKDCELVGFIGTHDSGSIGLLEVFPENRKHGIGVSLVKKMIMYQQKKGNLPFSEIFEDNTISMKLAREAGMQLSGNTAIWCYKK